MKYIFGFLFLTLIGLFETSVLPFFPIFNSQPDLLLVILLALQFLGFSQESYYAAFFGGVLFDLLAGNLFFGLSSLVLLLLVGAAGLVRRFASASPLILLLITAVTSAIFRTVQVLPTINLTAFLKGGLLDAGLMLLVYPTLRYILGNVFGRREIQVGV